MINRLKLRHFKAFKDELVIDFGSKNLLIYGENGSGKSSIYEALKIVFFKSKLEQDIEVVATPEEQIQVNNDFWNKFNNKNANLNFSIKINEEEYSEVSIENYQCFMISINNIQLDDKIKLDKFLENFFFHIDDVGNFCLENHLSVEAEINEKLQLFNEHIRVTIDKEDGYFVKIIDSIRNLESKRELNKYFNEAKLNLIKLLLLFNSIRCAKEEGKEKILILDDFITSLDVSNRAFLMRYILDEFADFQIIILTHNVNFYNLIMYLIKDIYKTKDKWNFGNIYELNNNNKFYIKNSLDNVEKIKAQYNDNPEQIEEIGNKIRQKFEVLLYEYSKLLMIGAVEENKKILARIENSNNLYYYNKKTASDLVDELETILSLENSYNLAGSLLAKINLYKQNEFHNIKEILKSLKLYKKITMNPMSHGHIGQTAFTTTEINQTLKLMEKFEKQLKSLTDNDVAGM